jgi:hypothetical protein
MPRLAPLLLLLLPLHGFASDSMRCGTNLISNGDRAFEVLERCGEPLQREQIGYTLGGYDRRELKIEEWVYRNSGGFIFILTFEGSRLIRIESRRSP